MEIKIDKSVEEVFKKYINASNTFWNDSLLSFLLEKKRKYSIELAQLKRRYNVKTPVELEMKIKDGSVPEHPSWEDLIDMENIMDEMKTIENDIRKIS